MRKKSRSRNITGYYSKCLVSFPDTFFYEGLKKIKKGTIKEFSLDIFTKKGEVILFTQKTSIKKCNSILMPTKLIERMAV